MKFIVIRTSSCYDNDIPPCPEAKLESVPNWYYCTFKTEEEYNSRVGGRWCNSGTEHGLWYGGIKRRIQDVNVWTIELDTMDDLLEFCKKNNNRVIITTVYEPNYRHPLEYPQLEIYDNYRE